MSKFYSTDIDDGGGVDAISRQGLLDARKLFEESLQKVKKRTPTTTTNTTPNSVTRVEEEEDISSMHHSSELMHLLLTSTTTKKKPPPGHSADHVTTARTPVGVQKIPDVDLHACRKNAAVSSTYPPKTKVSEVPAASGCERTSVFTCDQLDEYLENDRMQDALTVPGEYDQPRRDAQPFTDNVKDLDVASWNGKTSTVEQPHASASVFAPAKDDDIPESTRSAEDSRVSEVEVDFIDGFPFYSFTTSDALRQHVNDSETPLRPAAGPAPLPSTRTKKFQYGIAGNVAKYLPKMKGWTEKRTTASSSAMVCDSQNSDAALDALLGDRMLRPLSDVDAFAVRGLDLGSSSPATEDTLTDGQ